MSSFTKPLIVRHINGTSWELMETFEYYLENGEEIVRVPKGFITDFASIPRLFWSFIGHPTGRYGKAAIVHDWCYFKRVFTRKKCDQIFEEAMEVLGVNWFKRKAMYFSVRAFGWIPWRKK